MNPESIGLLTIRMFLEVLQAHVSFQALKCSDRSTFSVIRILTIPLMVMVDISLGYSFTYFSLLGIGVIVVSFLFFNTKNKTLDFTGWYYVLFTAVNAVITISLFKYSITHF
ncbi:MAG: hypothetical protein H6767_04010 [Candidatus Peribacteria bacterium]|nr:MAG: hypothetical protein H6767_04010 [Candidatus Peribacteria bacterium]